MRNAVGSLRRSGAARTGRAWATDAAKGLWPERTEAGRAFYAEGVAAPARCYRRAGGAPCGLKRRKARKMRAF